MGEAKRCEGFIITVPSTFRTTPAIHQSFYSHFPNLREISWLIKSPWNDDYQCIAWAACRTNIRWWPVEGNPRIYWPPGVELNDRIEAFIQVFSTIGYTPCGDDRSFEFGYQKVAIYATSDRRVQHMARQHFWGRGWLSKCGILEDILHPNLQCLEGDPSPMLAALGKTYGEVSLILKRSWWSAFIHLCLFRCMWDGFKFWLYRLVHPSWT